jgi:hypothetical protein
MGDVLGFCGTALPGFSPIDVSDLTTPDLLLTLLPALLFVQKPRYGVTNITTFFTASIRLSCPFLLFVVHQAIKEQLDFQKSLKPHLPSSYIVPTQSVLSALRDGSFVAGDSISSSSGSSPEVINERFRKIGVMEGLNRQSVDILLESCRTQVRIVKVSGLRQTAVIF